MSCRRRHSWHRTGQSTWGSLFREGKQQAKEEVGGTVGLVANGYGAAGNERGTPAADVVRLKA
jgi:hypothetical protein